MPALERLELFLLLLFLLLLMHQALLAGRGKEIRGDT